MDVISKRLKQHFFNSFKEFDEEYFSSVSPKPLQKPELGNVNDLLVRDLGLEANFLKNRETFNLLSGSNIPSNITPISLVYSGHQFGVWAGQLGDGRAITLGELSVDGDLWDIQLKGAGTTPYSRLGDGRAVLRSSVREYLCSEAMHALGIPTTRALCIFNSKTPVYREYTENAAVICRLARSHIRFGSFEHFHHRGEKSAVKNLAQYVIQRHFSDWNNCESNYKKLFRFAVLNTARTIAKWQAIGFCHGVMNTDNMSILGDTIDYGPFGFLDEYTPSFICNQSDHQGRYSFQNQPKIGLWNLNALALAFSTLIPDTELVETLNEYQPEYEKVYTRLMADKFGLEHAPSKKLKIIERLLEPLATNKIDYCIFFRSLSNYKLAGENTPIRDMFLCLGDFYKWSADYNKLLQHEIVSEEVRRKKMLDVNPKYILRNHMAQEAITLAECGDFSLVTDLLHLLQHPYDENSAMSKYALRPPKWASTISISCSS
tara:strand:+ start:6326 stop:7792 length:1467 start_codon:yes stop_codon:yes gene_type:complete